MEPTRQKIAAEQIEEAMKARGLGRKQFADLMHRNPSEVTKWLSGKHNFTIALLQEISNVLGVQITGVENIDALINGFEDGIVADSLEEPSAVYGIGTGLSRKIKRRSAELGLSAMKYIEGLVDAVRRVETLGKAHFRDACRSRAVKEFRKEDRYAEYIELYERLTK